VDETVRISGVFRDAAARFPELSAEFYLMCGAYSVGFYDAAVFHSMRVTEFLLKRVAVWLGVSVSPSWDAIRQRLSKEIDRRTRSEDRRWQQYESFFSSLLFDIQAISKEYRNTVMHDLGTHYDPGSTRLVLVAVEGLVHHITKSLPEDVLATEN
jgi:hypothetical protein